MKTTDQKKNKKSEALEPFYTRLEDRVHLYKKKYPTNPVKTFINLVFWCTKYAVRSSFAKAKHVVSRCLTTKSINEKPKILFSLGGGVGDIIIASTYLKELYKFMGERCLFSVCTEQQRQAIESIFCGCFWIDKICEKSAMYNTNDYDVLIGLNRFPYILYRNSAFKKNNSLAIRDLFDCYENFNQTQSKLCVLSGYQDTLSVMYSLMNGQTRRSQPDIGHKLGMSDDTRPIMVLKEDAYDILKKAELKNRTYITIQRGVHESNRGNKHTRVWSKKCYDELIQKIHAEFPSLTIVQVGRPNPESNLIGVDVDLRGKTSFEELKVVLKNSALHIDGECGMVHLTHALNGRSAVFFGPTNMDFFGYPENINVKAKDACPLWCEWVTNDWQAQCLRGFDVPPCMEQLTPELFFAAIHEHLQTVTNEKTYTLNETENPTVPPGTLVFIGDFSDAAILPSVSPENRVFQFSMNLTPEAIRNKAAAQITADYADILNIPMKKASCDAVFCSQTEPLSPPAIRELTRILRLGGVLQIKGGRFYVKE